VAQLLLAQGFCIMLGFCSLRVFYAKLVAHSCTVEDALWLFGGCSHYITLMVGWVGKLLLLNMGFGVLVFHSSPLYGVEWILCTQILKTVSYKLKVFEYTNTSSLYLTVFRWQMPCLWSWCYLLYIWYMQC